MDLASFLKELFAGDISNIFLERSQSHEEKHDPTI